MRSLSSSERRVYRRRTTGSGVAAEHTTTTCPCRSTRACSSVSAWSSGRPSRPSSTTAGMVRSSCGGSARSALVTAMAVGTRRSPVTSLRDYLSTVSTGVWPENSVGGAGVEVDEASRCKRGQVDRAIGGGSGARRGRARVDDRRWF
ncbi:exported hypothetical protein [Streptomyces misionensis JCM 4497]